MLLLVDWGYFYPTLCFSPERVRGKQLILPSEGYPPALRDGVLEPLLGQYPSCLTGTCNIGRK